MRLYDWLKAIDKDQTWVDMPVIVADEIAKQIDSITHLPDYHTPKAEEYGVVAPPFKIFFVEATVFQDGHKVRKGACFMDISEDALSGAIQTSKKGLPDNTHFVMSMNAWMLIDETRSFSYPATLFIHMNKEGYILDDMNEMNLAIETFRNIEDSRYLPAEDLAGHVPFTLKAISAMHKRAPVEHIKPPRGARRRWQKRQKDKNAELTDYYVLKVKPTKGDQAFEEVGQPASVKKRQHAVRGHFRYYTEDAPLFGRVTGAVWVPAHERGTDTLGNIRKDYEVSPED